MPKKNLSAADVSIAVKRESEVWIYSYADLLTNLMAFFILLLTLRVSDSENVQKIKDSFSKLKGQSPVAGQMTESELGITVTEMIAQLPSSYQIAVQKNSEGVSLSFMGGLFFNTLSTDLSPEAKQILDMLAPIVKKMPKNLRVDVAGHSDNRPVKSTDLYPSNWELSAARAGVVVRYLEQQGVPANRMRAIGYSSTREISNVPEQNRRVVISIGRGILP